MTLDLTKYRHQTPVIKLWLDNKPNWLYKDEVGLIAIVTNIPIIAVSYYIGEIYGFSEEIKNKIASDRKFYKIESVIGEF